MLFDSRLDENIFYIATETIPVLDDSCDGKYDPADHQTVQFRVEKFASK